MIDHLWYEYKEWCEACGKSRFEVVENNIHCIAMQMFSAVWELGR